MNGLTLLALIALAIGILAAYRFGAMHGRREARPATQATSAPCERSLLSRPPIHQCRRPRRSRPQLRSRTGSATSARDWCAVTKPSWGPCGWRSSRARPKPAQLRDFAADRRRLFVALADARAETARYRQVVVDIENNAPPPLLDGPGSPDDLKLIVGIGPVLERMLQQLGVGTYRQIARWSERDIDEFDAKLAEFPGRIRRDAWVTQARELHQSKYGERP